MRLLTTLRSCAFSPRQSLAWDRENAEHVLESIEQGRAYSLDADFTLQAHRNGKFEA